LNLYPPPPDELIDDHVDVGDAIVPEGHETEVHPWCSSGGVDFVLETRSSFPPLGHAADHLVSSGSGDRFSRVCDQQYEHPVM
jgi:hypothetical protein